MHAGEFPGRMDDDGWVRVPHGLGGIPDSWVVRPMARFSINLTIVDDAFLLISIGGAGPFRRWFPIEWSAERT